ncbi:MFS transporter [Actinocrinis sp.]|uniref:MFS transporter n=1 Tax=Actinocrinis sp. TaxID=1920516 RepID=UPI002D48CCF4|nr:MFS transporter [Actinocrinis sp.]HZP50922.1 MFS transporter [Actinocrinis sp.]
MSEPSPRRRQLILAICCMSLFIVAIDNTIVNVALPSIQHDLHAPVSGLQWIIDAYTLVLASLLMLAGSTADRLGRRRIFQLGLVLFTLASALCSAAPSLGWLVAFRALQAVGGSMLNPVAMSIISNTFTDAKERARAIGVWGGVVGLSMAAGPVLGGLLVQAVGWRSVFWVNIPVGVAALVLTALFVPESRAQRGRRPDPIGQILVIAVLAAVTYAIIEGPDHRWTSPLILGLFAFTAAGVAALVRYESRREEPLIELRFFRSIPFSGATVIAVCAFIALAGFLFINTLYLQDVRGFSAMKAGLMTLPMAAITAVFAPLSGRLVAERGARGPLLASGIFIGVTGLLFLSVTNTTSLLYLGIVYALFGFGFGVVNAPITNTAVSGMPRAQSGVAAAVASTSRQVGQSLGVALIGTVAVARVHGSMREGFSTASHVGWAIVAGCGLVVAVLGVLTTTARAKASAERAAALFPASERGTSATGSGTPADAAPAADQRADSAPRGSSRTRGTENEPVTAEPDTEPEPAVFRTVTTRTGAAAPPDTETR